MPNSMALVITHDGDGIGRDNDSTNTLEQSNQTNITKQNLTKQI